MCKRTRCSYAKPQALNSHIHILFENRYKEYRWFSSLMIDSIPCAYEESSELYQDETTHNETPMLSSLDGLDIELIRHGKIGLAESEDLVRGLILSRIPSTYLYSLGLNCAF